MAKKRFGTVIDILMYVLLIVQMLHVFIANTVHELLGITFIICLIIHIIIKGWYFKAVFKKGRSALRRFSDVITCLLLISSVILMLSSMGVSRLLFPWFHFLESPEFHRYMATSTLTLAVLHGGLQGIIRAKKKVAITILVIVACIASLSLGLFGIPYINRHYQKVDISLSDKTSGDKIEITGSKPLVVYFTRVGNTDFDADVDAVSSASLLMADGKLMGSNQLISEMICDILDCQAVPITVTGEKYPSSYDDTVVLASKELNENKRPAIEPIDVSEYDSIVLVYPLWWNSIPMPVATFLEQNDFSNKTIYLIATQGSSGYGNTVSEVESLCPNAKVVPVTSIYCEDIPNARGELLNLFNGLYHINY